MSSGNLQGGKARDGRSLPHMGSARVRGSGELLARGQRIRDAGEQRTVTSKYRRLSSCGTALIPGTLYV